MKRIFTTSFLCCLLILGKAQILTQATSPSTIGSMVPGYSQVASYNTTTLNYTPPAPVPDPPTPVDEDTTTEDIKVWDYASPFSVNISMNNGNITNTSIGKVWTLRISVPNALNISIIFEQFNLSSNAEMYIFNEERTVIKGSIKKGDFTNTNGITTAPMKGNRIIMYIVEPSNFGTLQSVITIKKLMLGYRNIDDVGSIGSDLQVEGIGCDPMIMCSSDKLPTARAVARFFTGNGAQCTGTLLNNEASNGRAFFLTAFHCLDINKNFLGWIVGNNTLDPDEIAALDNAVFQFQAWRTECNGTVNNAFVEFSGAVVRGASPTSDVALLEITSRPPGVGDGVNYAGWNRGTQAPSDNNSFIIHHPEGQDMRITKTKKVKTFAWNNRFWTVHYSSGTVARGSSGSALFNESNQAVGQLRSGWSSCTFTDFGDRYGKFSTSWQVAGIQPWLSPNQNLLSTSALILSPLVIQGPTVIYCSNPVQFSVPSNLLGCTYSWVPGANLQITSGQGTGRVTVIANPLVSGRTNIQVTITDSKGRNRVVTASTIVNIVTTPPQTPAITSHFYEPCIGIDATCNTPSFTTSYLWKLDGLPEKQTTIPEVSYAESEFGASSYHLLSVKAVNGCGASSSSPVKQIFTKTCNNNEIIDVYPNPTQGDVIVVASDSTSGTTKIQHQKIYDIRVIDIFGITKKQYRYSPGVTRTHIDLSDLSNGIYFIHAFNGTIWGYKKITVIH